MQNTIGNGLSIEYVDMVSYHSPPVYSYFTGWKGNALGIFSNLWECDSKEEHNKFCNQSIELKVGVRIF